MKIFQEPCSNAHLKKENERKSAVSDDTQSQVNLLSTSCQCIEDDGDTCFLSEASFTTYQGHYARRTDEMFCPFLVDDCHRRIPR